MWSAQYDRWKKKTRLIREHLVVVVKPKKVLLTYTLFHDKIQNFFSSSSHLQSRNLLEITATNNITKTA